MSTRRFQRLAIVNRGEPAMRLIHAVRELNRETDRGLVSIALYTEPDRRSMFVREADESFDLGSATYLDPADGERKVRYLDYARLEEALVATGAEAVWVGWGFVAEHAAFADLCRRLGIVFIGPDGEVMRRLGDKITSKLLAEQAEVPVAPWSGGPVDSLDEARLHATRLGFPLMVKATAGGGGRGIRKIHSLAELATALQSARSEALKAFGDATVFLEKMVPAAHHVEVQVIADRHGTAWALGVRDCTIQRRNQKVLEETPSPVLTPAQDDSLRRAAVRLAAAAGYHNAGTVEFLYEPQSKAFWFMEVNARLQVEHPVTEAVTGVDLVKLQLHVAEGGRLDGEPPAAVGHAIEVRLNAEDPDRGFAPAPGTIDLFRLPTGPGLRIDTGVEEGDVVPPQFDSMIAKLIAHGRTRDEALARLRRALSQTTLVVRGGTTNKAFLQELLGRREVIDATVDVGWLDGATREGGHLTRRHADIALYQAAIDAYDQEVSIERSHFLSSAARGRPEVSTAIGRQAELRYQGQTYELRVFRLGAQRYQIEVDGRRLTARLERLGRAGSRLSLGGRTHRTFSVPQGPDHLVEVDDVPHRISRDQGGVVRSPAPAVVVSLHVAEGDVVEAGERLVVLEAMKMEMAVTADFGGRVGRVLVRENVQVENGAPLLILETEEGGRDTSAGVERVELSGLEEVRPPTASLADCRRNLGDLRGLMLGYDVDSAELNLLVAEHGLLCEDKPPGDVELARREEEVLRIFVDLANLFRRQPAADDLDGGRRATEEYLFAYLRTFDEQAALPPGFLDKLRRAVAHYGIQSLQRTPELEECLFRIFRSHARMGQQIAPLLSILERHLANLEVMETLRDASFGALLDQIVTSTRWDHPALADLAQEVHYRQFERPFLDEIRRKVYDEAEGHLQELERAPGGVDRGERIKALVDCPQPLTGLLSARYDRATPEMRAVLLEAMTRRYYRIRGLEQLETPVVDGHCVLEAAYDFEGRRIHAFTTHAGFDRLEEVAGGLVPRIAQVPADEDVVVDFYLRRPGGRGEREPLRDAILAALATGGLPPGLRRVVVAVGHTEGEYGFGGMQHFTFRPAGSGYAEEVLYRDLHPMMGKRLQLWRLENFETERLESPEDIYLFRGVARDNSKDERLFALAEVRDLTPVRDDSGQLLRLPQLERTFLEAAAAIRRVQARKSPRRRLHWNRIVLNVWPPLDLQPGELSLIAGRHRSAAEDLGLEKVVIRGRVPDAQTGRLRESVAEINLGGHGHLAVRFRRPAEEPIRPLSEYSRKVVFLRQHGLVYPYELIKMLAPSREDTEAELPAGEFVEHDLDASGHLVPVERPMGENTANLVVGVIRSFNDRYPEGMTRVILLGDPSRGLGSLAEPECRRILAGLDLAERLRIPVEWFAVSAGAKIAMDSGTENMDWIARVLRRLVELTQAGGEVNIVVAGINVGAQPYWNAEATMLMHTRGILVMTPETAMVLTGKQALDYSGGVSAEDNRGIGGYERVMGPNGQAQYLARDIGEACRILLRHYELTYVAPGERFPRRVATHDPRQRDIRDTPHGKEFARVGEIFSDATNPGRKRPFDIRRVLRAVCDQDQEPLERWYGMQDAEIAVVWDACLGGYPICLLGLESRPLPRLGFVPADGPDQWTAGTLFPQSSKKVARAINAASGNRPVVVLANLSGFDGSPESLRKWQLEYGAEIGRAVVNFKGPLVFCVVSRYHGGAFVVFSAALNDNLEVAALEGSYASVIGGAPAAAVVFSRQVAKRTREDPRVQALEERAESAQGPEKAKLRAQLEELYQRVHSEKLGQMAEDFDQVHSIHRAKEVGSVHRIIDPSQLRPYLVDAIERGMRRSVPDVEVPAPTGALP